MPDELNSISPLDGRYYEKLKDLSLYFSEFALIKSRVFVELSYLKKLGKGEFMSVYDKFSLSEAEKVKKIEKETNHDLKAVEYYLREKVPAKAKPFVHYGLTSEDINNIAYSLCVKAFIENVYLEKAASLLKTLKRLSLENKSTAMLSRTHGQAASPTTLGKEFLVFHSRIEDQYALLQVHSLKAKFSGATGNFSALNIAEPDRDWPAFAREFITELGLFPNLMTTQIEPHDSLVALFQIIKRLDNIILDLDKDIWLYIMLGYFGIELSPNEIGSSTMPHKVNPIDFENSEGNAKIANSLFTGLEDLQVSRLQRDLSDSTMMRNIGVAFGHSMLAIISADKGLSKLVPNTASIEKDLDAHPEILTEAVQTVMRKNGIPDAYEKLKELSRGKTITLEDLRQFIRKLDINKEDKERLLNLTPSGYIGLAGKLTD